MPQPKNFGEYSIEAESADPNSPLSVFRKALALRKELLAPEEMTWHETEDSNVLHFSRPNGPGSQSLHCITNFGRNYYNFDALLKNGGELIHASGPFAKADTLPPATTVWVKASL